MGVDAQAGCTESPCHVPLPFPLHKTPLSLLVCFPDPSASHCSGGPLTQVRPLRVPVCGGQGLTDMECFLEEGVCRLHVRMVVLLFSTVAWEHCSVMDCTVTY